jgi:hypothetical protein
MEHRSDTVVTEAQRLRTRPSFDRDPVRETIAFSLTIYIIKIMEKRVTGVPQSR